LHQSAHLPSEEVAILEQTVSNPCSIIRLRNYWI